MSIALLALAALTSPFAAPANAARIYVYAQFETPARSWLLVSCDNDGVAQLKRGMFFAIDATPGRHVLSIGDKGVPAAIELHAGEELFVRLDWHYERDAPPVPALHTVPHDVAHKEMLNLKYIDADRILSASVPKADPRGRPQLKPRGKAAQQ